MDGRIEKIYQPERDEILFNIRTLSGHERLVISANSAHPRIHLTHEQKQNPITAPLFCMLLRKHLSSGKITGIIQDAYERIIRIAVESYNELGDLTVKNLIVELTGRNSNIILTDSDMRIIDSVKRVDFTVSSVRQILPGTAYQLPPPQEKIPYLSPERSVAVFDFSQPGLRAEQVLMNAISGISPLTARELVFRALGSCGMPTGELSEAQKETLSEFVRTAELPFEPCMLRDKSTDKAMDFSSFLILQTKGLYNVIPYESMSVLLEEFYQKRDRDERMRQKSADLVHLLHTALERTNKKQVLQQKTLRDAENKEQYKIYADLLTANLYRIPEGADKVTVENYYDPALPEITIRLDPSLSPSQNAQRYYKKYNKQKTAEIEVAKQLKMTREDLAYLESTLVSVGQCTQESDLNEIRRELAEVGFLKKQTRKKQKQPESKPMHFTSSDGFDIYVGKNNTQNDYLTLRLANQQDLWFHTKNIHGSHAVIKLGIEKNVPDRTIAEAAALAAYFSKARESSKVPVDYTQIKNVKKPNGAKPGMVIYDSYNTIYVEPKLLLLQDKIK